MRLECRATKKSVQNQRGHESPRQAGWDSMNFSDSLYLSVGAGGRTPHHTVAKVEGRHGWIFRGVLV